MAKSRTSFKKGEGGRPKGVKNKNYLDASHWLQRADQEVEKEKNAEKRVSIVKWATELIMQKVPLLPATPGDSVSNAAAAAALMKALEADTDDDTDAIPAPAGSK